MARRRTDRRRKTHRRRTHRRRTSRGGGGTMGKLATAALAMMGGPPKRPKASNYGITSNSKFNTHEQFEKALTQYDRAMHDYEEKMTEYGRSNPPKYPVNLLDISRRTNIYHPPKMPERSNYGLHNERLFSNNNEIVKALVEYDKDMHEYDENFKTWYNYYVKRINNPPNTELPASFDLENTASATK